MLEPFSQTLVMHAITFDIDWVPDFIIDSVATQLESARIPSTWFVTHGSKAIDRLASKSDLFELGIHPNFRPNSSHGESPRDVLNYCISLVPHATSMRTHGLIQSISLYDEIMRSTNIKIDVTTYMPRALDTTPVVYERYGKSMFRAVTYWQDELELSRHDPILHVADLPQGTGLRVYNFHPILLYVNAIDARVFHQIIGESPELLSAQESTISKYIHNGHGLRSFFSELLSSSFQFGKLSDAF